MNTGHVFLLATLILIAPHAKKEEYWWYVAAIFLSLYVGFPLIDAYYALLTQ